MTTLILTFVIGMTILMLQFDRGLPEPGSQSRGNSKGFGLPNLIRGFHVDRAQRVLQKRTTREKV
jgi:hypothetical protein